MKTLRHLDFKNGNKIIMDVCWRHLKGNESAYLSVSVRVVKHNGVLITDYQEKTQAIKEINAEFYQLVSGRLTSSGGVEKFITDGVESAWSAIQKARGDIFSRPTTKEDYQAWIEQVIGEYKEHLKNYCKRKHLNGRKIADVWLDFKTIADTAETVLGSIDKLPHFLSSNPYSGYAYRFLLAGDIEKTVYQWQKELLAEPEMGLAAFVDELKGLLSLKNKAPSAASLYTKQVLADKYDIALKTVDRFLVAEDKKILHDILAPELEYKYDTLIELTEILEIPTVTK